MNKRLEEILQRKEEIRSLLADETNKNLNFDELEKEVRELDEEEKEIRRRQTIINNIGNGMTTRTNTTKPVKANIYDSEEYRQAFMNYVCRGEKIPQEFRSDEVTATTDIGALVPPVTKCERKAPKFIYGDISSLKNNDSISLFFIVLYF